MNEKQALQDVENVLRDFISAGLDKKFGPDWFSKCGLPDDRIAKWKEKLEIENKKQKHSSCDPRLIYYSDFYDLRNMLNKNWDIFSAALGEKKEVDALLGMLENYRNSNAHGRELLTYQKHLVVGITGEIRNRITKFRSMQETGADYFPRIESVHDNYGNSWKVDEYGIVRTGKLLREGDVLEYIVSATDPQGEELEYSIRHNEWQKSRVLQLTILKEHIGLGTKIYISIRSTREYHANKSGDDDSVIFKYDVLPNQ
ncbi:hypothetical protein GCM10028824_19750 [Hymenobacter segetis]|uniref:Swt1 family HEPN domain-containing protein n=1 Tax=Hymenobacter segetis TaxID=2025509 RepID=A0ABU9LVA4_9BACT